MSGSGQNTQNVKAPSASSGNVWAQGANALKSTLTSGKSAAGSANASNQKNFNAAAINNLSAGNVATAPVVKAPKTHLTAASRTNTASKLQPLQRTGSYSSAVVLTVKSNGSDAISNESSNINSANNSTEHHGHLSFKDKLVAANEATKKEKDEAEEKPKSGKWVPPIPKATRPNVDREHRDSTLGASFRDRFKPSTESDSINPSSERRFGNAFTRNIHSSADKDRDEPSTRKFGLGIANRAANSKSTFPSSSGAHSARERGDRDSAEVREKERERIERKKRFDDISKVRYPAHKLLDIYTKNRQGIVAMAPGFICDKEYFSEFITTEGANLEPELLSDFDYKSFNSEWFQEQQKHRSERQVVPKKDYDDDHDLHDAVSHVTSNNDNQDSHSHSLPKGESKWRSTAIGSSSKPEWSRDNDSKGKNKENDNKMSMGLDFMAEQARLFEMEREHANKPTTDSVLHDDAIKEMSKVGPTGFFAYEAANEKNQHLDDILNAPLEKDLDRPPEEEFVPVVEIDEEVFHENGTFGEINGNDDSFNYQAEPDAAVNDDYLKSDPAGFEQILRQQNIHSTSVPSEFEQKSRVLQAFEMRNFGMNQPPVQTQHLRRTGDFDTAAFGQRFDRSLSRGNAGSDNFVNMNMFEQQQLQQLELEKIRRERIKAAQLAEQQHLQEQERVERERRQALLLRQRQAQLTGFHSSGRSSSTMDVSVDELLSGPASRSGNLQNFYSNESGPLSQSISQTQIRYIPGQWYYRDPQGNAQGPFSSQQMRQWLEKEYFKPSLEITRHAPTNVYQPLKKYFAEISKAFLEEVTVAPIAADPYAKARQQAEEAARLNMIQRQRYEQQKILQQQQQRELAIRKGIHDDANMFTFKSNAEAEDHGFLDFQMHNAKPKPKEQADLSMNSQTFVEQERQYPEQQASSSYAKALNKEKEDVKKKDDAFAMLGAQLASLSTENDKPKVSDHMPKASEPHFDEMRTSEKPNNNVMAGLNLKKMLGVHNQGTKSQMNVDNPLSKPSIYEHVQEGSVVSTEAPAANPWKKPVVKPAVNLLDIQEEEQRRLKEEMVSGTYRPAENKAWANIISQNAPQPQMGLNYTSKSGPQPMQSQSSAKVHLQNRDATANLIKNSSNQNELLKWSLDQCKTLRTRVRVDDDLIALFQFAMTLGAPEIREVFGDNLGSTPEISKFATEFINKKDNLTQKKESSSKSSVNGGNSKSNSKSGSFVTIAGKKGKK